MCLERGYLLTWPLVQERINASSDAKHSIVLKLQHGFWLLVFKFPLRMSVWDSLKFPCFLTDFRLPLFWVLQRDEHWFSVEPSDPVDVGHDRFVLILINYFAKGRTTTWVQRILHSALAVAECSVLPPNGFNTVKDSRRRPRPQSWSVGHVEDTKPRLCQDSNCNRLALATLYSDYRLVQGYSKWLSWF